MKRPLSCTLRQKLALEEATTAKAQLDENVFTFDSLATERGLGVADIDLGDIEQGQLSDEIDAALFGTKELGIFGPFETDLGPALFRVNASIDAQNTTFEEATAELTAEYVGEETRLMIVEMVTDIDDLLAQGLTLEEIANETEMDLNTISMAPDTADDIAAYDEFRTQAFAARKTDFPTLVDLSDGGIFALRLDEIIEPTLRPLADVKDQVIADWAKATDLAAVQRNADELVSQLDTGAEFAALDLTPKSEQNATRDAFFEGVPASLIADLFETEVGKTKQVTLGDRVVVARLTDVTPFDPSTDEGKLLQGQVQTQLANQVTGDLLRLFSTALETRDGVTLNQEAINQINAQILGGTGGL